MDAGNAILKIAGVKDPVIGSLPVYRTYKDAKKYAGNKYQIITVEHDN
jgi:hypothetical protein